MNRHLKHLSLNNCGLGKEAVDAIGEGLAKNTKLESISLRSNLLGLKHITEFMDSCVNNKRLVLRHVDLSSNSLCDEAGIQLAKCFKELKFLETINLKNNCLGEQAGEALLYLVKEMPQITRCNVELNMTKFCQLTEIDRICKANHKQASTINVPLIKKEIQGLKRLKNREAQSISDINV